MAGYYTPPAVRDARPDDEMWNVLPGDVPIMGPDELREVLAKDHGPSSSYLERWAKLRRLETLVEEPPCVDGIDIHCFPVREFKGLNGDL